MRGGNKIRGRTSAAGSGILVMHISVPSPSFSFVVGILGVVVVLQVHIGRPDGVLFSVHSPYRLSPRDGLRGDFVSLSFLSLSLRSSRFVRIAIVY